jgi:HEAT repeat protein
MEELKTLASSGQFQPTDPVWSPGMAEWTPASQIKGLLFSESEPASQLASEVPDAWYYGDGEQRHGPVSMNELRELASSGKIQPTDLVWSRGMAEWTAASEVKGLFSSQARPSLPSSPPDSPPLDKAAVPPVSTPSLKERVERIRDAAAPHLSQAAKASRDNLERSWKFIERQHLGTRLRLLMSRLADGVVWCYNAARPHAVKICSKRPCKQEMKDASAAGVQKAVGIWNGMGASRKPVLIGAVLLGLAVVVLLFLNRPRVKDEPIESHAGVADNPLAVTGHNSENPKDQQTGLWSGWELSNNAAPVRLHFGTDHYVRFVGNNKRLHTGHSLNTGIWKYEIDRSKSPATLFLNFADQETHANLRVEGFVAFLSDDRIEVRLKGGDQPKAFKNSQRDNEPSKGEDVFVLRRAPRADVEWFNEAHGGGLREPATGKDAATAAFNRGVEFQQKGDLATTFSCYDEAIRLDGNLADAYFNRAMVWETQGDIAKAIVDCSESIRISPDDARYYRYRSSLYESAGEMEKSIADCSSGIRILPQVASGYYIRGYAYLHQGDNQSAINDFNEAIRLDAKCFQACYGRGLAHRATGDQERAITDFNATLALCPDLVDAYLTRTAVNATRTEIGKVLEDLKQIRKLAPELQMCVLAPLLVDKNERYRKAVIQSVVRVGNAAIPTLIALARAHGDQGDAIGRVFLQIIWRQGPSDIPALRELLRNEDAMVRSAAAYALCTMGPAAKDVVPEVTELLRDKEENVRAAVADALKEIGPAAIPALRNLLRDKERAVRVAAAEVLGKIGLAAKDAIPELTEMLRDNKEDCVRTAAAEALGKIGPAAKDAIPELTEMLRDKARFTPVPAAGHPTPAGGNVCSFAAEALGHIGPAAKAAIPKLTELLRDKDWFVRRAAVTALGGIGPAAIPALIELTHDEDADVRIAAYCALGETGLAAKDIIPELMRFLRDERLLSRTAAAQALGNIGPAAKAAIPELTELLRDKDVRRAAAEALGKIGPAAKAAIPKLTELLRDNGLLVRTVAAEALGKIGPAAAIPELTELLGDETEFVRTAAAEALGKIGPAAIPALTELTHDKNDNIQQAAVIALGEIGPAAIPVLTKLLQEEIDVRVAAAEALGKIGRAAIPALTELTHDNDQDVRDCAAKALGKVRMANEMKPAAQPGPTKAVEPEAGTVVPVAAKPVKTNAAEKPVEPRMPKPVPPTVPKPVEPVPPTQPKPAHTMPTDPETSLKVGTQLCFMENKWTEGLPMLAQGNDAQLKELAAADLKGESSADGQKKLGDSWWDFASDKTDIVWKASHQRAVFWYRKVVAADPSMKKELDQRIATVEHLPDGFAVIKRQVGSHPDKDSYEARCTHLALEVTKAGKADPQKSLAMGSGVAGLELKGVRLLELKVKASPDLESANENIRNKNVFAGFMVDYQTAEGYAKRVALCLTAFSKERDVNAPGWGKKSVPDDYVDLGRRDSYQLDLQKWSPPGWTGQVWFGIALHQRKPNMFVKAEIIPQTAR